MISTYCENPEYHSDHLLRMMEDIFRIANSDARQSLEERMRAYDYAENFLIKREEHLKNCVDKGEE